MPFLYHGNNKLWSRISLAISCSWWRRNLFRSSKKNKKEISTDSVTPPGTDATTRDWRSLSPNDPPLPFVLDNPNGPINGVDLHSQIPEQPPKCLPNSYRQVPEEGNLSTIIEESDLRTEISASPRSSTGYHWNTYQEQTPSPKHDDIRNSNDFTNSQPSHTALKDSISSRSSSASSSSTSSLSTHSFQPPPAWPIHPKTERRWSSSCSPLPTNEKKAKRKFAKMIQAAYRFRQEHKHDIPSEIELLFDANDTIDQLRLWIHGTIHYHSFEGNAQYIPPELSTRCIYRSDKVDVWVLGISLYRMLVGRYPFHANDDRRLLKKMQHADFGIPSYLSTDAKDLLRRMLAPDQVRASLDLVIFHPWLKPHTVLLLPPPSKQSITKAVTPILTSPRVVPDDLGPFKQTNDGTRHKRKSILTKAMVFIVEGPYPPPKQPYHALS